MKNVALLIRAVKMDCEKDTAQFASKGDLASGDANALTLAAADVVASSSRSDSSGLPRQRAGVAPPPVWPVAAEAGTD
jgi:hypothetical protein